MIGVITGSFDPVTKGHVDIIRRAAVICDKLYVVAAVNSAKKTVSAETRIRLLTAACSGIANLTVTYTAGAIADFVTETDADVIIKGIRNTADLVYESEMAELNKDLCGKDTLFLLADRSMAHISSSGVKELLRLGKNIERYVPEGLAEEIRQEYAVLEER